jgi:hypothetical protein
MNPELRALQQQAEQDRTSAIQTQVAQESQSLTARFGELTDYDNSAIMAHYSSIATGISPLLAKARG